MSGLHGPKREAASGKGTALVILLHGYGADGNDLIGIGEVLAEYLPEVKFLAPNAPDPCINNPLGYQWCPIPRLDGSSEESAAQAMARAVDLLNAYLDDVAVEEGIGPDRTVLVGFSQGAMMGLHVGPRRAQALAGIVGFSGWLAAPERLPSEIRTRPSVLLVHGDIDDVVPPAALPAAAEGLTAAGIQVTTHVSGGMGHGIAPDGLGLALRRIQEVLGISAGAHGD